MRPRERVVVLPSSSAAEDRSVRQVQRHTRYQVIPAGATADLEVHIQEVGEWEKEEVEARMEHTSQHLLDVIEHQVHQLVMALQRPLYYSQHTQKKSANREPK